MFGVIIHFYLKENFYYFYIQETPQCTFHSVWWHIFSAFVFSSLAMWAIDFGPRHCLPSDGWSSHHIAVIGGGPRSFHQLSLSSFVFWVTCMNVMVVQVSLWTVCPNLAFPWIMQSVGKINPITQGRQKDDQLCGIHIPCSHYQPSLLVLHRGGNSINLCLKARWALTCGLSFWWQLFCQP